MRTSQLKNLESFVKVCMKLDELRFRNTIDWKELAPNIHKNENLKNSEKIFLFWLCSVIDQFYNYEKIWTDGERAMLIVLKTCNSSSDFEALLSDIRKDKKGNVIADIPLNEENFTLVRDDFLRIKNTLDYLANSKYEGDLHTRFIKLLGDAISSIEGSHRMLKFAHLLNCTLWENSRFLSVSERELEKFRNKQRKRLWMFIMFLRRDPSILRIFEKALLEVYGKIEGKRIFSIWIDEEKFSQKEIELPGDMWNIRLFKAMGIRKNARRTARKLSKIYGISPSVFDVTFEIGANKCTKGCKNCPFGDNELCHKGTEKYCPIPDWLFLSTKEPKILCEPENCPIGKDLGKNLCGRKIDFGIEH